MRDYTERETEMDGKCLMKLCVVLANQDRGFLPARGDRAMALYEIGLSYTRNDAVYRDTMCQKCRNLTKI